ncbi:MAG: KH domain-containing protein [Candidatus Saccharimonadales bacterium]
MSIDQQFVEFVIKSLVTKPEAVQIERRIDEKGVLLELTVDPEDLGRVIGKRGATAQSVRTLLRALGTKNDARYNLKIIDNGVGSSGAESEASSKGGAWGGDSTASDTDNAVTATTTTKSDDDADADVVEEKEKENTSDAVAKTRRELHELDDLDV